MMSEETIGASDEGKNLRNVLVDTILNLEELEPGLYRGDHHWRNFNGTLFGGQVVGQALVAASHTVSPHQHVHSLHCYFIKFGTPKHPVLYKVTNLRDGKSYATRSVHASQDGKVILTMMASFHRKEESPLQHQYSMPVVPKPHRLQNDTELVDLYVKKSHLPNFLKDEIEKRLTKELPLELRRVDPFRLLVNAPSEPQLKVWVKAKGDIGDDMRMHQCVAAYLSDYFLVTAMALPHRQKGQRFGQMASLDHSLWFHAPFRTDQWMLYECESAKTGAGRGISHGRLWQEDGTLVASLVQEGVLRPKL